MIQMKCGCKFETNERGEPIFDDTLETLPDCSEVWKLIGEGNTTGCFQIEGRVGKQVCKKVKPKNIEELADIGALIRPSCLEGKLEDGKNIMEHYAMRKHFLEEPTTICTALEPILKDTQMLLLYQESMIKIMQEIGGFSEIEADSARKAAGKKKADVMAKIKKEFIDGSAKTGKVSQEQAEQIFDWVEKSQRYSFNKSHAVSYAYLSYGTAYAKAHFPIKFFRSYLDHSKDKTKPLDEINRLIIDAKKNNINVYTPDIRLKNIDFCINNKAIYFGLSHIKGLGEKVCQEIIDAIPDNLDKLTWNEILFEHLFHMRKSAVKILISCGAFDCIKMPRKKMLYEHDKILSLKESEVKYILEHCDITKVSPEYCIDILRSSEVGKGKVIATKRRVVALNDLYSSISNPPYSLKDSIEEIASWEATFLGISITCSKFDLIRKSGAETECGDFEKNFDKKFIVIGQVKRISEYIDKNGDEMAFFAISDDSGEIESCLSFAKTWDKFKHLIQDMEILKFVGYKTEEGSFILNHCEEIN